MSTSIGAVGHYDPSMLYQSLFKKVDSNGDGSIDKTEFKNAVSSMASNQTDSSSSIDEMFSKLDTDSNGTVSSDEMMNALKAMGEQRRAHMPHPPHGNNGGGPDFQSMAQNLISDLDTDGDGSLNKSEFNAAISGLSQTDGSNSTDSSSAFSKLDTNNDGVIDSSELASGLKNMRPHKPHSGEDKDDATDGSASFQQKIFSDLVNSLGTSSSDSSSETNSADALSSGSAGNAIFADLIKSLKSSNTAQSDQLSEIFNSIKQSSGSSDDQITSMFNDLLNNLQNSSGYGSQGTSSYSTNFYQSLLSVVA